MHNFDDSWGPMRSHIPLPHISKNSQTLLNDLAEKPKSRLSGWLAEVVDNTGFEGKESHVDTWLPQRYALIEDSARRLIDSLFLELSRYSREFNASAQGEQMSLSVKPPGPTLTLTCKRDPSYEPYKFTCYEGHIASHSWVILIRSYYEIIQIFILPSRMLFGLESDRLDADVKALVELRPAVNEQNVKWALGEVVLQEESLIGFAKELFSDFIKVAVGLMDPCALFLASKDHSECKHGKEKEEVIQMLEDLQLWQARGLVTKAIAKDTEVLMRASNDSTLREDLRTRLETLLARYSKEQVAWGALISTMNELFAECRKDELAESR